MAISKVTGPVSDENGTGASTVLVDMADVACLADDEIVVVCAINQTSNEDSFTSFSASGSAGGGMLGSWTIIQTRQGSETYLAIGRARFAMDSTLADVTATLIGSRKAAITAYVFRGTDAGTWGQSNTNGGSSSTPNSSTISSIPSGAWLIGFAAIENVVTVSAEDPNFSDAASVVSSSGGGSGSTKVTLITEVDQSAASSDQWGVTISAIQSWQAGMVVIPAAATGTTFTQDLNATLSFTGGLAKRPDKTLAGVLTFTGGIAKQARRTLAGSLTFTGGIVRRAGKALTGGLTFAGGLTTARIFLQTFNAGLSFAGALTKQTRRSLAGGLTFAGGLAKQAGKALAGDLSFVGSMTKRTSRTLLAGLSLSGALARSKTALMTFNAGLSFAGGLTKQTSKALSGGLGFTGALTKQTRRSLTGGLTFAGGLVRRTGKELEAGLSFTGGLAKQTARMLMGGLAFTGGFAAEKLVAGGQMFFATFNAGLSFSGSLLRHTSRSFEAVLIPVGTLSKSIFRSFSSTLSFLVAFDARIPVLYTQAFNAVLSFSAGLVPERLLRIGGSALERSKNWYLRRRTGLRPR